MSKILGAEPSLRLPVDAPRKPSYASPCNGCGLCCTATACSLALAFVAGAEDGSPCPALEWSEGRSWCGLLRNPAKHVTPLLWLAIRRRQTRFQASIAEDLIKGGCDSGALGGIGEDEWLGWTAAEYADHAAEFGLTWEAQDDRKDGSSPQTTEAIEARQRVEG